MGEIAHSVVVRQVSVVITSVREQQLQRLRAMTGEEKIRAAEALRAAVWELKAAWIRSQHPDFSETAVQDAVRGWFSAPTP
jgi:hypothetical protein